MRGRYRQFIVSNWSTRRFGRDVSRQTKQEQQSRTESLESRTPHDHEPKQTVERDYQRHVLFGFYDASSNCWGKKKKASVTKLPCQQTVQCQNTQCVSHTKCMKINQNTKRLYEAETPSDVIILFEWVDILMRPAPSKELHGGRQHTWGSLHYFSLTVQFIKDYFSCRSGYLFIVL